MRERFEIFVCVDCMLLEETGDASSFDYHYSERAAKARLQDCETGWQELRKQGSVFHDSVDVPQHECGDCGHVGLTSHFEKARDQYDDLVHMCPNCRSPNTSERSSGFDEFSTHDCDCCGTALSGARYRYSVFPKEVADAT